MSTSTIEKTTHQGGSKAGGLARRQNFLTAIIGGVVFAWLFWWIARLLGDQSSRSFSDLTATATCLGWLFGFWLGIGALNGPFAWLIGRDQTRADQLYYAGENMGTSRY